MRPARQYLGVLCHLFAKFFFQNAAADPFIELTEIRPNQAEKRNLVVPFPKLPAIVIEQHE
jgi:hypothetical protein